jgi:hypothetical protein
MNVLHVVLLIAAFLCFLFAAAGVVGRVNLVGLGLALWVLTLLIHG